MTLTYGKYSNYHFKQCSRGSNSSIQALDGIRMENTTKNPNGTFSITPSWITEENDAGKTVYSLDNNCGVFAGATYDWQILNGEAVVASGTFETSAGDPIENGDMSQWCETKEMLPLFGSKKLQYGIRVPVGAIQLQAFGIVVTTRETRLHVHKTRQKCFMRMVAGFWRFISRCSCLRQPFYRYIYICQYERNRLIGQNTNTLHGRQLFV